MTKECPNCAFAVADTFRYCPHCGQKTGLHRLSLHDVLHDAIHYFTHADKSVFGLVKSLAVKTGTVAREYVGGKRKKYFPPLNFFLLVATVFVLIIGLAELRTTTAVQTEHPEINRIPDAAQRERVRGIYERRDKAVHFINKYSNIVAMVAAPLLCILFWRFYRQAGYNYTEHLVACLYMIGFSNLVYVVVFVPLSLLGNTRHSNTSLVLAFMLFQIGYSAVFYYQFINRRSQPAAWKAFGVSALVTVLWFGLSSLLVGIYIRTGFGAG